MWGSRIFRRYRHVIVSPKGAIDRNMDVVIVCMAVGDGIKLVCQSLWLVMTYSTWGTSYTSRTRKMDASTVANHKMTAFHRSFRHLVLYQVQNPALAAIGRKHKPHRSQRAGRPPKPQNSSRGSVGRIFRMGNEESSPVDESVPPQTLSGRTLEALGDYIKSGKVSKICVMVGAGISTSAGIPDFRSPDTGLYANLARLNLPYAEAVFDIGYFRENPEPFYTLAHELYPGKYRPTITHSFIKLLQDKGMLLKLFTQNIDCLEREAGVSDDKIVEAHGSFARQSCIEWSTFFQNRMLPSQADLCIVMGTSLTVQPFASLPQMTREQTPRVLINKERVGGIGSQPDDILLLGDCDDGVRRLAKACGWLEDLNKLWAQTAPKTATETLEKPAEEAKQDKDEALDNEINKLTREVDETLNLSKWHTEKARGENLQGQKSGEDSRNELVNQASASEKQTQSRRVDRGMRPWIWRTQKTQLFLAATRRNDFTVLPFVYPSVALLAVHILYPILESLKHASIFEGRESAFAHRVALVFGNLMVK
ncbi:NAD-dependent protein deacetylase [Hortaea werneckii]|nr:NAD-dependent protein deacetylase [Hortaea werneckii]